MRNDYFLRSDCRMCGSQDLELDLSLASLPIGDRYLPEAQKDLTNKTYPLNVMCCKQCGHYQNSGYINAELIYQNYLSRPATTNPVLSDAYKEYAEYLLTEFKTKNQIFSIEAGSNDGAFSKYLKDKGAKILCIEPAPNLVKQANEQGIYTLQDYFSFKLAKKVSADHGLADYFIANHMFANVNDSADFLKGVHHLLKDTGVFSMQTFYHVDVIEKNLIENFTHEHLSYFYVKPFSNFCERYGMELFDVKRISAKGGSIRCFVQKRGGPHRVKPSVSELIKLEDYMMMGKPSRHDNVAKFIHQTKQKFLKLLVPEIQKGKAVVGFGTSIGATTFLYNYGLGELINFFVDDDPYRHNLVSPGYHIPVLPSKFIYEHKPDYVIILAPLYADIIIKKNQKYLEEGGTFIKFWPKFEVLKK
jgi:SAM-dependent methyltransferase